MAASSKDFTSDSLAGILALCGTLALIGIAVAFALMVALAVAPFVLIGWLFTRYNPLPPDTKIFLFSVTLGVTIIFYFILNPWLGLIGVIVLGGGVTLWYFNHPWRQAKRTYDAELARHKTLTLVPPDKFRLVQEEVAKQDELDTTDPTVEYMLDVMEAMYREDYKVQTFPPFPPFDLRYDTHQLAAVAEEVQQVMTYCEQDIERVIRTEQLVKDVFEIAFVAAGDFPKHGPLLAPLYEMVPDVRKTVGRIVRTLYSDKYTEMGIGETVRQRYMTNAINASSKLRSDRDIERLGDVTVLEHPGTAEEVMNEYLSGTRLIDLFQMPVAFPLPEHLRPEHGVIIAGSGGGKSQLLESLILADLEDEARPGVILIDSKGEMIERIAHLACFHPDHGALRDHLIIIDHKDKPALNMFAMDEELVNAKINEVASLMRYFFGGLFGSQLSDQMDVLFLPLLHMILRMPGATLHTFAELVGNPRKYPDVLARIPPGPRSFIVNHYDDRAYAPTKTGIVTRLHRIINEVTLDDMFSAPNNAVDIGQALNDGKIILVSTDADGLQDLSPIFGKYFIAQVMNAGLSRGSRQREGRRPIHFYIDECAPYVDDKLAQMLTTIRSYGIGVMMAFQGQWQMNTYTPVIVGNTAIKIMGTVDDDGDAKAFANSMRTDPDFIMSQRKQGGVGQFACYTRELPRAVCVGLPFGKLDEWEQMGDDDYVRLRASNRSQLMAMSVAGMPSGDFDNTTIDGTTDEGSSGGPAVQVPRRRRSPQPGHSPSRAQLHSPSAEGMFRRGAHIDPDVGTRTEPAGDWEP